MINADSDRINTLGVVPNGFGHEEKKTVALLRMVNMMVNPASIGQGYTKRAEGLRHNCSMGCR